MLAPARRGHAALMNYRNQRSHASDEGEAVQHCHISSASGDASVHADKCGEKLFEDLGASVHRRTTQVHDEAALDVAFKRSDNVYLVFSAHKSGEYFGYARMLAPISGDLAAATAPAPPEQSSPDDGPQSILTPATVTAPSGRIINDSARGTIFWEADDLTEEDGSSLKETSDATAEQDLGRPFIIE
ncbi:hypothetical protein B0A48_18696 [Cryoendolithus antarcticus]|uniref:YTH domain-containing protein n=1 Tax=Cryoendolithus antarcticus TaxID=1507870 RepID=A0A1V8S8D2_9PEZI|nr:hypothetical protein B0A48_18696 [Cryoendolithus antarcticus]